MNNLSLFETIKDINLVKRIRKSLLYSRLRQYFPMPQPHYVDDRDHIDFNEAEIVCIDWPADIKKPVFGVVQDYDEYPKWTKYCRFLENNHFEYDLYNIYQHSWMEKAEKFDIILGIPSNTFYDLQGLRIKYEVLESYLGKKCYPASAYARLYEDKTLEAYISSATHLPFAKTYVSHDQEDALSLLRTLKYPIVSKIVPSSGSLGVELIKTFDQGRHIVKETFSRSGRKTHLTSYHQKNFVYFQEFIPSDGWDLRVIVVGSWVFGFYRKVLEGDFRASGMHDWEKREIPEEAIRIAFQVNQVIKSPLLAVDMLRGLDGKYTIIEFSPTYQMDSPEELHVNGIPGVYVFEEDGSFHFQQGRYWVSELALREFLLCHYLPKVRELSSLV